MFHIYSQATPVKRTIHGQCKKMDRRQKAYVIEKYGAP